MKYLLYIILLGGLLDLSGTAQAYECVPFQEKTIQHPLVAPDGKPEILCVAWEGQLSPSGLPARTYESLVTQNTLTGLYEHKYKFKSQGVFILKTPGGAQMTIDVVDTAKKTRLRELQGMIEERDGIIREQAKDIKNLTFTVYTLNLQLENVTRLYQEDEAFIDANLTRRDSVQMTDEQAKKFAEIIVQETQNPWKDRIAWVGWIALGILSIRAWAKSSSDMARS